MTAIEVCRTAALGGHVKPCEDCAHTRVAYNSCRNRHCPKWERADMPFPIFPHMLRHACGGGKPPYMSER
jgi:hypothetical protein